MSGMGKYTLRGKRAVIHARESKLEKRQGTRSTAEQVDESTAWCASEGVEVAHVVIEDGVGASRHAKNRNRKRWDETKRLLLEGDQRGPLDLLVTWSATRAHAGRSLDQYVDLRRLCVEAGVLWCFDGRVYDLDDGDDRFDSGLRSLLGEREVEELRKNTLRGIRANIAAGKPHGPTLYGYRRIYDEHTGEFLAQEIEPDEADLVRRIFSLYLAGHSTATIAGMLRAENVPTPSGEGRWIGANVRGFLVNAAYAGRRLHNGVDVGDACWPEIIDPDTWSAVADRLRLRSSRWDRPSPRKLLLTGLARCAVCNLRMVAWHTQGPAYVCQDKARHVTRRVDRLDEFATDLLLRRLAMVDLEAPSEDPAVTAARLRVTELKAELADAMALWRSERLSVGAYSEMESDLLPRIAEAERLARRALVPLSVDIPAPERLAGWWVDELSGEQRREVMASRVAAVMVAPVGRGNRNYRDADYTTIEWR